MDLEQVISGSMTELIQKIEKNNQSGSMGWVEREVSSDTLDIEMTIAKITLIIKICLCYYTKECESLTQILKILSFVFHNTMSPLKLLRN